MKGSLIIAQLLVLPLLCYYFFIILFLFLLFLRADFFLLAHLNVNKVDLLKAEILVVLFFLLRFIIEVEKAELVSFRVEPFPGFLNLHIFQLHKITLRLEYYAVQLCRYLPLHLYLLQTLLQLQPLQLLLLEHLLHLHCIALVLLPWTLTPHGRLHRLLLIEPFGLNKLVEGCLNVLDRHEFEFGGPLLLEGRPLK